MDFIDKHTDIKFEKGSLYEWPHQALIKALEPTVRHPLASLNGESIRPRGPIMFLEYKSRKYKVIHRDNIGEFHFNLFGWKVLYKDKVYVLERRHLFFLQKRNFFLEKIC